MDPERDSNKILESAHLYIQVPKASDVKALLDPEEYLNKLNEISSPSERLITFIKSIAVSDENDLTYESRMFRKLVTCATIGSAVVGGILKSKDHHENFIRRHNATLFDNKHSVSRRYLDTLGLNIGARGLQYGFKACVATSAVGLLTFGSMVYRGQLCLPDFILGYAALGAISRTWLGPRAMMGGGIIGAITGTIVFGVFKTVELASGYHYSQIRLIEHRNHIEKVQNRLRYNQLYAQKFHADILKEAEERGDI